MGNNTKDVLYVLMMTILESKRLYNFLFIVIRTFEMEGGGGNEILVANFNRSFVFCKFIYRNGKIYI